MCYCYFEQLTAQVQLVYFNSDMKTTTDKCDESKDLMLCASGLSIKVVSSLMQSTSHVWGDVGTPIIVPKACLYLPKFPPSAILISQQQFMRKIHKHLIQSFLKSDTCVHMNIYPDLGPRKYTTVHCSMYIVHVHCAFGQLSACKELHKMYNAMYLQYNVQLCIVNV